MEARVSSTSSSSWLILNEFPLLVRLCSDFCVFNPKHDKTLPIFSYIQLRRSSFSLYALLCFSLKTSQTHTQQTIQTMTSYIEAHNLNIARVSKTRFFYYTFFLSSELGACDTYRKILRLSGGYDVNRWFLFFLSLLPLKYKLD